MTPVGLRSVCQPHSRRAAADRAVCSLLTVMALAALTVACGTESRPDASVTTPTDQAPTTAAGPETTIPDTTTTSTGPPPPMTAPSTSPPPPTTARPRSIVTPSTTSPPPPGDPRVTRVSAADLGASWHAGCPVGPADLRRVVVTYVGFDGVEHEGALVVHADAVRSIQMVFERLRTARFPINKVVPVDRYGASDDASMADDNTSAFNCRRSTGSASTWSQHAYGRAIDVNPLENPYVSGSSVQPPGGAAYLDRNHVRTGMAVAGNPLVAAFSAVGWGWGGNWNTVKDYQHFSATGR